MFILTTYLVDAHQNRYLSPEEIEELRPILGLPIVNDVSILEGYISSDEVEILPRPVNEPTKAYPDIEQHDTRPYVIIEVVLYIDKNGTVEQVAIVSAPFEIVAKRCQQAIMAWSFNPAIRNGKPVPCYLKLSVHYKIDRNDYQDQNEPVVSTPFRAARSTP